MIIYVDSEFKCHTTDTNNIYREFDVEFFDGKCTKMVEGYRFVPFGESWTRSDGEVFAGEMIAPWKPFDELNSAQQEYEKQLLTEYSEALQLLGVNLNDN